MHGENILKFFQKRTKITYLKDSAVFQGVILTLLIVLLSGGASKICTEALENLLPSADREIYSSIFFSAFLGIVSIGWIKLIKKWQWTRIGLNNLSWSALIGSILSGIGICLLLLILGSVLLELLPVESQPQELSQMATVAGSWQQVLGIYLISSILAPISEGIFFRGVLYQSMAEEVGRKKAVVIASLIFAMMHFDLYRLLLLWIAGMWLNILRIKFDSIFTSMIAHSVWNTLMITLAFLA